MGRLSSNRDEDMKDMEELQAQINRIVGRVDADGNPLQDNLTAIDALWAQLQQTSEHFSQFIDELCDMYEYYNKNNKLSKEHIAELAKIHAARKAGEL